MKLQKSLRIQLALLLSLPALLFGPALARGEAIVYGTNEVVVLNVNVPTNQVLELSARHLVPAMGIAFWRITQYGTSHTFAIRDSLWTGQDSLLGSSTRPTLLAGPMTLQMQIGQLTEPGWVNYRLLPLSQLHTVIVPARTNSIDPPITRTVTIPTGIQFRLLSLTGHSSDGLPPGPGDQPTLSVSHPGGSNRAQFREEHWFIADLAGPLEVHVANNNDTALPEEADPMTMTYTLFDETVTLLPNRILSVSGGSLPRVERTTDLDTWEASALLLDSGAPQSFFRLRATW